MRYLFFVFLVAVAACESRAVVDTGSTSVQPVQAASGGGASGGTSGVNEPAGATQKCQPACASKQCGADGCGGWCGSAGGGCAASQICDMTSGQCQAASGGGATTSGGATMYCPANSVYCAPGSTASAIKCVLFTGTASGGQCDVQTKPTNFTASGISFSGGVGFVQCDKTANGGATHWENCPKGQHNPVGSYTPYEDFVCAPLGYACGKGAAAGSGGGAASGALPSGDVTCVMRRIDSTSWITLFGGGSVSGTISSASPWADLGSPSNSQVSFGIKSSDTNWIGLPKISATPQQYARGWVGESSTNVTIGTWGLKCPNVGEIVWNASTPTCTGHKTDGLFQPCVDDQGQDFHRFAVRLR